MSGKTVVQKLLIKPEDRVWLSDRSRLDLLGELPQGAEVLDTPERANVWLVFVVDAGALAAILEELSDRLRDVEKLWFAYPKGNRTDLNRDTVWPVVAQHGVRPVTQMAIDKVWSALRFRALREGEAQFAGGRRS